MELQISANKMSDICTFIIKIYVFKILIIISNYNINTSIYDIIEIYLNKI